MQTEVTIRYKTIRYLTVWNHYGISMLWIDKRYWTICSTVKLIWLPFDSGWFRRSSSYLASRKSSRPPNRDDILAIILRCKREKTFTRISSSSLLLRNDFSLYQIDFSLCWIGIRCVSQSTSICVETTLYKNERKPLKSVLDCIAHTRTMRCTLGLIQHGGRVMQKNVLVPYIIGVLIKEITLLLEN